MGVIDAPTQRVWLSSEPVASVAVDKAVTVIRPIAETLLQITSPPEVVTV